MRTTEELVAELEWAFKGADKPREMTSIDRAVAARKLAAQFVARTLLVGKEMTPTEARRVENMVSIITRNIGTPRKPAMQSIIAEARKIKAEQI